MTERDRREPLWPTYVRTSLPGGRLAGVDSSMWLYRRVPTAPVSDARTPADALQASTPLFSALEELAAMPSIRVPRRGMARASYRHVHLLAVNVPRLYVPPREHPLAGYLASNHSKTEIDQRTLLLGVRLIANVGGTGGIRAAVDSVVETLVSGGTPISDFDRDYHSVSAALARCGLSEPPAGDRKLAESWFNHGRNPDCFTLPHLDHLHVFASSEGARLAEEFGRHDCGAWPPIPRHHTLAFGAVHEFDLPHVDARDSRAWWAAALLDSGAVAVSVRGLVEPAKVTRNELRRRRRQYIADVTERSSQGKMDRAEQDEMLDELTRAEDIYAGGGTPTLTDASVLVAFSGRDASGSFDLTGAGPTSLSLLNMENRHAAALAETMLCSRTRANPYLHDLPIQTIACSGISSLSTVGDKVGALLGFTERDRQPAYLDQTAAVDADSVPIMVVAGQSGSGKTITMLNLADQFARTRNAHGEQTPVIILDPKHASFHDDAIRASGGQVASLDDLASSDGIFDPLRFSATKEVGVELAANMLMSVNPWGSVKADYETPLLRALSYGATNGAGCVGEALTIASSAGQAEDQLIQPVFDLANASPMFRACVGVRPGTEALRVAGGITLIRVGSSHIELPDPGAPASEMSVGQRVGLAIVRMMVFGSAMALAGREGVLAMDEAWMMLSAGRSEVERLGRLARSQNFLPMMFTQRITDALEASLAGYISRGLILPIQDESEAVAACKLFNLEPTPARLRRLMAKASLANSDDAPNWDSMRALRGSSGEMLRGAVGIYVDLAGNAVPTEITIPRSFLTKASTNPEDIRRREEAKRVAGLPESNGPDIGAAKRDPGNEPREAWMTW
ncbi:ATP-binding protein [Phytoactinopolyspora mesophila]|uniref:Uncharacterized protein n=1 Tax=Phytoactinopolyspora mesophila TaxID=2650750 RepID=A0A7K3MAN3_9ACTN|nr:ATP-binding protein [Phytoactinopolyspora mesophila]NDL60240.1 hypothetical protein [Phytoactinopolyspora mesophila]